ncbi:VWA domain-containing protein [Clostridium hydrogeniformans]|uniref:VWA domain-containing protein n=1 Tax=Clostridium hydrogeniformans TaxID=349933 RepID=UPI000691BF8B|nr:VWA domain-containing protein [Clostridium hydrogeniformans]
MGIQIGNPYVLIAIPVLIALVIIFARLSRGLNREKKVQGTVIRSIIIILLSLALGGFKIYWNVDKVSTIFLLDSSDSNYSNRLDIETFVGKAIEGKGNKDLIGIISFGENTQIESFISKDPSFKKIEGNILGSYTNLEGAINSAVSLFPNDSKKRLVILSDGEENKGLGQRTLDTLKEQGIEVKVSKSEKNLGKEVSVEGLSLPEKLNMGQEFNLVININSTTTNKSKLHLYNGREKIGEESVDLQSGENRFVFKDKATSGGFKAYKVVLDPEEDSEKRNNEAVAFVNVSDTPKVLVIEDKEGESVGVSEVLKKSQMEYKVIKSHLAPRAIEDMMVYKSIITCNVSAENLNNGFMTNIESYVRDFGGGYIALGGDNSFALGGYFDTPLEKILPVNMEMKGKKEIPKMSLMLVIDKSGSMTAGSDGINKMEMAKEAAIRSLKSLRKGKDEIGVLTFDGSYKWVVERKVVDNPEDIEADIGSIRADGGTSILPALNAGYESLKESDAKIKHIILLTDGQAENSGYESVLKAINDNEITASTVAVGLDSDRNLLESIAKECHGRFYEVTDSSSIPAIFAKETMMATKKYLNNREFTPIISSNHSILKGFNEGFPNLLGYIGASEKDKARRILKSDEDDPILTAWQYGLGKTVAWNSDLSGKWSKNYTTWQDNLKLWQNIIGYTISNYNEDDSIISFSNDGDKLNINFEDKNNNEELDTMATIVRPDGEKLETKLYSISPGKYSGEIDLKDSGVYMVNVKSTKNGEIITVQNSAYAMQYSPEYNIRDNKNNFLDFLNKEGIASFINNPEDVFKGELKVKKAYKDLTFLLIGLSVIIFLIDIALRRFNIDISYYVKPLMEKVRTSKNTINVRGKNESPKKITIENQPKEKKIKREVKENVKDTINTNVLLKNKKFKK